MPNKFVNYQQEDIVNIWDNVSKEYNPKYCKNPENEAILQNIVQAIGDPNGKTICEVGCGSGFYSAELAKMGGKIILVDISPQSLECAKNHFCSRGLDAVYSMQNALDMNFEDNSFDVVWNLGVIEHFEDEGKVILMKEMWRILRPGGCLFIGLPSGMDLPFMLGKIIAQINGTWIYGFEDNFGPWKLRRLCQSAGIVDAQIFSFDPIAGWRFLPYLGKVAQLLGLDTLKKHMKKSFFGHILTLISIKK